MSSYFPAEWHPQEAVLIAWPNEKTDWSYLLPEVSRYYCELAEAITRFEKLVVLCHNKQLVRSLLGRCDQSRLILVELEYNDTWARDFSPITVVEQGRLIALDYKFNGWGGKFQSELDNSITTSLFKQGIFSSLVQYRSRLDFILEGGSVESNGAGVLLTTSSCLLSEQRNSMYTRAGIERTLMNDLFCQKVLWLESGQLEGDDTDGHIDTLARFCNQNTIAYVQCKDQSDPHYTSLQSMERELEELTDQNGDTFNLVPLPMVEPVYNKEGERLGATYANFLIINGAVLVPIYGVGTDELACSIIGEIFPEREVIAINCRVLIEEGGSLHCTTMQLPKGVI